MLPIKIPINMNVTAISPNSIFENCVSLLILNANPIPYNIPIIADITSIIKTAVSIIPEGIPAVVPVAGKSVLQKAASLSVVAVVAPGGV